METDGIMRKLSLKLGAGAPGLLLTAMLLAACTPEAPPQEQEQEQDPAPVFRHEGTLTVFDAGAPVVTVDIEIADTDSLRNRGLMGRESLPDLSGMLFVFDQASIQNFYMANTPLSLDFLFIGPDSVVVNTVKYAQPLSLGNISSTGPAQWVLEMPAGFVDTYGLMAGNRVEWSRSDGVGS